MYIPEFSKNQLLERLKFSMTKKEVLRLAQAFAEQRVDIEELINLACSSDSSVAFHTAWVLENILFSNPQALDYYLINLIKLFPVAESTSVRRHFGKMVAYGIRRVVNKDTLKIYERELWMANLEPLEETCFKWFVEEDTKPAVKAHCLEILYLLSTREKWIAEELPHIIENQMQYGSPGLKAKGRAILKLLK
jgi:hypothetical protein